MIAIIAHQKLNKSITYYNRLTSIAHQGRGDSYVRTLCIKHLQKAKLQGERKFPDKYESKGGNKNKSNKKNA